MAMSLEILVQELRKVLRNLLASSEEITTTIEEKPSHKSMIEKMNIFRSGGEKK